MNEQNFLSENQKKVLLNRGFNKNTVKSISKQSTIKELSNLKNNNHKKYINEIYYIDVIIKFNSKDSAEINYKYSNFEDLLSYIKKIIGQDSILTSIFIENNNQTFLIYHENMKNKENIKKITKGSIIYSINVPKLSPIELANLILNEKDGPERISELKPAATLNNGGISNTFRNNWIYYTNKEKDILKYELSKFLKLDIDIYSRHPHYLFYSKKYMTLLAEIYGYTLIEALDILTITFKHNNKRKDFIYICFGDLYGLGGEPEVNLKTNNGRLKLNKYFEKINEFK
jgi:hypothetical protein